MKNAMRVSSTGLAAGLGCVVATGLLSGCALPPPAGQDNFRVEATDTTRAERYDTRITVTELTEFSDQVVAQLTEDLKRVPELNERRVTVIFGDIENKTGIVSTTDFEAFRSRVRQKLLQSKHVLQNIQFAENRTKVESLKQREQNQDVVREPGKSTIPERHEDYTFFLNGEFYRVERAGVNRESSHYYSASFNLMRMGDGIVVWSSSPYESKRAVQNR